MNASQSTKVYDSKRDQWIVVVIWIAVVILIITGISTVFLPLSLLWRIGLLLLHVLAGLFGLWVLYSTRYVLSDDTLKAKSGPFSWKVQLEKIKEVVPSRSIISAPACSLDRLCVKYKGSFFGLLISPIDKEEFLRDLTERCPQLALEGDRAVQREETSHAGV